MVDSGSHRVEAEPILVLCTKLSQFILKEHFHVESRRDEVTKPTTTTTPPAQPAVDRRTPTIADQYSDLLGLLNARQRRAIVVQLSVGYYEGWRPTRSEIADLVAVELNLMTADECLQRQRLRNAGRRPLNIIDTLLQIRR